VLSWISKTKQLWMLPWWLNSWKKLSYEEG
jgi:hypothetical protein